MSNATAITLDTVIQVSPNQVHSELGGEMVILNIPLGEYLGLEQTGARAWELIQEPKSVREVLAVLLDEYDVEASRCERELLAFFNDLSRHGLVQISEQLAAQPA
jgi:hypothetical protein